MADAKARLRLQPKKRRNTEQQITVSKKVKTKASLSFSETAAQSVRETKTETVKEADGKERTITYTVEHAKSMTVCIKQTIEQSETEFFQRIGREWAQLWDENCQFPTGSLENFVSFLREPAFWKGRFRDPPAELPLQKPLEFGLTANSRYYDQLQIWENIIATSRLPEECSKWKFAQATRFGPMTWQWALWPEYKTSPWWQHALKKLSQHYNLDDLSEKESEWFFVHFLNAENKGMEILMPQCLLLAIFQEIQEGNLKKKYVKEEEEKAREMLHRHKPGRTMREIDVDGKVALFNYNLVQHQPELRPIMELFDREKIQKRQEKEEFQNKSAAERAELLHQAQTQDFLARQRKKIDEDRHRVTMPHVPLSLYHIQTAEDLHTYSQIMAWGFPNEAQVLEWMELYHVAKPNLHLATVMAFLTQATQYHLHMGLVPRYFDETQKACMSLAKIPN